MEMIQAAEDGKDILDMEAAGLVNHTYTEASDLAIALAIGILRYLMVSDLMQATSHLYVYKMSQTLSSENKR